MCTAELGAVVDEWPRKEPAQHLRPPCGPVSFGHPVVFRPDGALVAGEFLGGAGEDGEVLTRRIVEGLPNYLHPGGRFYCLEFSQTQWPGFATIYETYSRRVVPRIGKAVAKDEDSYRYLIESIERFPDMPAFARMIEAAGFGNVKAEPILGGLVAIHSGWKV